MDFASSTRAAENRSRWKGIVANSSVVPDDLPRLWDKIENRNRIVCYKSSKIGTSVIIITIILKGVFCAMMCAKDADGATNTVDPI